MDSDISHEVEQRFRNIEAHLGIGHTDEDTGEYSVDTHESLLPPPVEEAPVEAAENPAPPKTVAELEAELAAAKEREGVQN